MNVKLYKKQCTHCGLKYFGKTTKDIETYKGSGKYWLRHISKYGKDKVITLEYWEFDNQEECTKFALKYSEDNNIVESKEWANIIPENGNDGNSSEVITEDLRKKFKKNNTGQNNPSHGKFWWNNGIDEIKSKDAPQGWKRGRSNKKKELMKEKRLGKTKGMSWWTDGIHSVKSYERPREDWVKGVDNNFKNRLLKMSDKAKELRNA